MLNLWLASTDPEKKLSTLGRVASAAVELLATNPNTCTAAGGWQDFYIVQPIRPMSNKCLLNASRIGKHYSINDLVAIRRLHGGRFCFSNFFPKDDLDDLRRLSLLLNRTIGHNHDLTTTISVPTNVCSYEWPLTLEELRQPFIDGRSLPPMPKLRPSTRQDALTYAIQWMVGRQVPVDLSGTEGIVATCLALESDLDGHDAYEKVFALRE